MLANRYVLEELLAMGGMGGVHVATDQRLGRRVAVKLLRQELAASAEFVERFRREALTAARLTHPSVARILDYGQDGDQHYIVMELVDGEDLARVLSRRGRLPAHEAVQIAAQVCDALSAAHVAGFVHRDIKPSNVIVTPDGFVKVTDFGIARALGGSPLTQTGTIMGTAQYIAPEQVRGESAIPASDLYAVGVLLFQMLTGRVPFDGDSPVTVAMQHLNSEVPRPGAEVAEVPPALDAIVARATAQSAHDRFADATEMAAALRTSLADPRATMAIPRPAAFPTGSEATAATARAALARPSESRPSTRALTADQAPTERRSPGRTTWILAGLAAVVAAAVTAAVVSGGGSTPSDTANPRTSVATSTQPTPSETPTGPILPPDLVGRDRQSVVDEVIQEGFNVRWSLVRSTAAEETVIGTVPAAGSTLTPGQTIVLVVSRGSAPAEVTSWEVSDSLIGLGVDEATALLQEAKVRVGDAPIPSDEPPGIVIGTWPAAGETTEDGVVVLVVSAGSDTGSDAAPEAPSDPNNNDKGRDKDEPKDKDDDD
jgi:serine/threonine-protein kinase